MSLLTGVIAAWPCTDGSGSAIADASGNGNALAISASPAWSTGILGGAVSFSGSNFASVNDNASLDTPTSGLTISVWAKVTGYQSGNATLLSKNYTASAPWAAPYTSYMLRVENSGTTLSMYVALGGVSRSLVVTGLTNVTNGWHHFVGVFTGSTLILYLDGSQVGIASYSGSLSYSGGPLTIAADTSLSPQGDHATVIMQQVDLWSRGLSATEVTALNNGGVGLAYPFISITPSPSSVPVGQGAQTLILTGTSTSWKTNTPFWANTGTVLSASVNQATQVATVSYLPPALSAGNPTVATFSNGADGAQGTVALTTFAAPTTAPMSTPGLFSQSRILASSTPLPSNPYTVIAGAAVNSVTFGSVDYLATDGVHIAVADNTGVKVWLLTTAGVEAAAWTVAHAMGGIGIDTSGNVYVLYPSTNTVEKFNSAGTSQGTFVCPNTADYAFGWNNGSTWQFVCTQRTVNQSGVTNSQLVTTALGNGGTIAIAADRPGTGSHVQGTQVPGGNLTLTDGYNGPYIRTYGSSGSRAFYFGSAGIRNNIATNGWNWNDLGPAVQMADGTFYVVDTGDGWYRFTATGIPSGYAPPAFGQLTSPYDATAINVAQFGPMCSDGTNLYLQSTSVQGKAGALLLSISRTNLDALCSYPQALSYRWSNLGPGAGIITSAATNYYANGSTPTVSLWLDAWWSQVASLTAQYRISTPYDLQSQAVKTWTALGALTTGGSTSIPVPSTTGHYQVEVQLLISGTAVSQEVKYVTVGPVGCAYNPASLTGSVASTPGETPGFNQLDRPVELANMLLGTYGLARYQLEWASILPGYTGGTGQTPTWTGVDTDLAAAAAYASANGLTFEVQIFQAAAIDNLIISSGATAYYVDALVARYGHGTGGLGYVDHWECYNEPDLAGYSGTSFAPVVIAIANAVHATDSSAKVVGPSISAVNITFLTAFATAGGTAVLDVIGFHPYGAYNQEHEEQGIRGLLTALLAISGVSGKPLWYTEYGGWTNALMPGHFLNTYAYTHALLIGLQYGVSKLSPYVTEGTGGRGPDQGLVYSLGGNLPNYVTMAGAACLGLTAAIGSRTYHDAPTTNAPHVSADHFVDSDQMLAIWSDGVSIPMQVTVTGGTGSINLTVWDAFGSTTTIAVQGIGGTYQWTQTPLPVYIQAPLGVTLTLRSQEQHLTNLALTATITASSSNSNSGGVAVLKDGICGDSSGYPISTAWFQAPTDLAPWILITLASAATVDRVVIMSHSPGSSIPSIRGYTVSVQVAGSWYPVGTVSAQCAVRGTEVAFPAVSNVTAVRINIQAANYGQYGAGGLPYFWPVPGNLNYHSNIPYTTADLVDPAQTVYGPAIIYEVEVWGLDPSYVNWQPVGVWH